MIFFILIISFLTIFLYLLYRDFLRVLKVNSIVSGLSGIFTLIIGYIVRFSMNSQMNFITVSKITNVILSKFLKNSIYLLALSLIELVLYIVINFFIKKEWWLLSKYKN